LVFNLDADLAFDLLLQDQNSFVPIIYVDHFRLSVLSKSLHP
jgi:hypothetical protein